MTRTIIFHSDRFDVVSYGNGVAYAVHDNENRKSFFVQGDDAMAFREEMEALPDDYPYAAFIKEQFAIRV